MEILFYLIPAALFYAWVIGLGWFAVRPGQPISARLAWGGRSRDLSFCRDTARLCRFTDRIVVACRASEAAGNGCDRLEKACRACVAER